MGEPILKIGAVVVKSVASGQWPVASEAQGASRSALHSSPTLTQPSPAGGEGLDQVSLAAATHHVLILQPIPKHAGETPAFVLPRGSRQYQDADGNWHDARDAETGKQFAATLEPYARALSREVEEEAGVTPAMLARAWVMELGEMAFQSRTKGVYPIYWYVVVLADADAATLTTNLPADAMSVRWAAFDAIKAMASRGEFSAGYVSVIERALALLS